MTAGTSWLAGPAAGRWRLASGLVLMLFASTHLLNAALGLVSLELLERGRTVFLAVWRLPPVELALALAALVHVALALGKLATRRTLRMGATDLLQLALGLLIPLWLTLHVLGTGWLHRCCGLEDSYTHYLDLIWPGGAGSQALLTLIVWSHGCIGLWLWLRLRPWARAAAPPLLAAALLLPAVALLGMVSAGREVARLRVDAPELMRSIAAREAWPDDATRTAMVHEPERWITDGWLVVALACLAVPVARWLVQRRRRFTVRYDGELRASAPVGWTLLEASHGAGIPHAAVCGGRGRCSTCRVRILAGQEQLPPPSEAERRVLERIHAGPDVRLACQLRPRRALTVARLMPAQATGAAAALRAMDPAQGRERELVVLFADLRGFTRLAEARLPYDTVYVLNRYFAAMGTAIERAGGRIDKFIGDGVMALFGVEAPIERAAREALAAAAAMADALQALNRELGTELAEPLRIGIGLHLGPAIVGEMGWGRAVSLTAVGDTVNVASRLEALTKELGVELVVSERVFARAGLAPPDATRAEIAVRGRRDPLAVLPIARAGELAARLATARAEAPAPLPWWRRLGRGALGAEHRRQ
jgi:adenylate cyclase